jgi:type VI secretion system protein
VTLTLELTSSSAASPGDAPQRAFDEQGGTIGRASSNTWVLTHNKVSGRHAVISFRNGVFYIEDTSRNGVSVNSMDNRLVRNRPYALKTGDRIIIEPYEIGVWIQGQPAAAPASRTDPFADADPFDAPGSGWPPAAASREIPGQGDVVDPLVLIPGGAPAPRKGPPPPVPADDLLEQHYQPPSVMPTAPPEKPPAAQAIPDGYNPLDDAFSEAPPAAAPRVSTPPPRPYAPPRPAPSTPSTGQPPASLATPPVAPPVIPSPPRSAAQVAAPVDDPFADSLAPNSAGASPGGPVPAAPLDLDALTGPPPAEVPPAPAKRPTPGVDAQARRRAIEPSPADSQTLRFPAPAAGPASGPIFIRPADIPAPAAASGPAIAPAADAES